LFSKRHHYHIIHQKVQLTVCDIEIVDFIQSGVIHTFAITRAKHHGGCYFVKFNFISLDGVCAIITVAATVAMCSFFFFIKNKRWFLFGIQTFKSDTRPCNILQNPAAV